MATRPEEPDDYDPGIGLMGTRAEALQRLKVGVGGVFAMLLLVGFASTIIEQTRNSADPVETVATGEEPAAKDPLVDIGVQPELPVEEVTVPDLPPDQVVDEQMPETGAPPAG